MKNCFDSKTYDKIYPSSSRPGLYFGLAKIHKIAARLNIFDDRQQPLSPADRIELTRDLPLRPVISNIGTATYELSRHLANLLKPLTKSEYSIESTQHFVEKLRGKSIPNGYRLVSFDVVSLFTKVPLDFTIELILNKIYRDRKIKTKISRDQMRKLLQICTKEMHFMFNGKIYRQVDGVAMGSPLGPVLANIFMSELESLLIPRLRNDVNLWFRYVDDTFAFVRDGKIDHVLGVINGFHPSIKFTHECESNGGISFLDVKITTLEDRTFATEVYRKDTDTNIYLHWQSFAPRAWKIGTLKGLIRRAFIVCSSLDAREREIAFLKRVFRGINGYPSRVVSDAIHEVQQKYEQNNSTLVVPDEVVAEESETKPTIVVPYKGKEGEKIVRQFRRALDRALPANVKPQIVYTGKKVGSYFRIKDRVPIEHQSNLIYAFKKDNSTLYNGETKVRYGDRTDEHRNKDKNSSVYKFLQENPMEVTEDNFEILETGFANKINRKIAEALYIKDFNPPLNERVRSFKLMLFN